MTPEGNVLVRARLRDGTVGYGEAVPREYVTGESPDSCARHIADALEGAWWRQRFGAILDAIEGLARGDEPPSREDLERLFRERWVPSAFGDRVTEESYERRVETLLGLHLEVDRLRIAPCVPADWPSYNGTLEGTRYSTREFFALPEAAAKPKAIGDEAASSAAE